MTPQEVLARYLYNSRPIVYRPWRDALEPAVQHYTIEAQQVMDVLALEGYQIVLLVNEKGRDQ